MTLELKQCSKCFGFQGSRVSLACLFSSLLEKIQSNIFFIDSLHCFNFKNDHIEKIKIATPYSAQDLKSLLDKTQEESTKNHVLFLSSFDNLVESNFSAEIISEQILDISKKTQLSFVGFTNNNSKKYIQKPMLEKLDFFCRI